MGRTLAIGDVHGCFGALKSLLSMAEVSADDQIIMLGDYVDRGPDSKSVVQWLIDQAEAGRLVALRGNHEIMMLNARLSPDDLRRWCKYGGSDTLASYTDDPDGIGGLEDVTEQHWQFLSEQLKSHHESDTHIFVHGFVTPSLPMDDQPDSSLYWSRYWADSPPHCSGKRIICGHKSQDSGYPAVSDHAICIDTAACKGGFLSCLHVESGVIWQAAESGATRTLHLDQLDTT